MPAPHDVQHARTAGRLQARDLHTSMPLHDKPIRVDWDGVVCWFLLILSGVVLALALTGGYR